MRILDPCTKCNKRNSHGCSCSTSGIFCTLLSGELWLEPTDGIPIRTVRISQESSEPRAPQPYTRTRALDSESLLARTEVAELERSDSVSWNLPHRASATAARRPWSKKFQAASQAERLLNLRIQKVRLPFLFQDSSC